MVGMLKDLGRIRDKMAMLQLNLVSRRSAARQEALHHLVTTAQLFRGNSASRQCVKPEDTFAAFGSAPEKLPSTVSRRPAIRSASQPARVATWIPSPTIIVRRFLKPAPVS